MLERVSEETKWSFKISFVPMKLVSRDAAPETTGDDAIGVSSL